MLNAKDQGEVQIGRVDNVGEQATERPEDLSTLEMRILSGFRTSDVTSRPRIAFTVSKRNGTRKVEMKAGCRSRAKTFFE